MAIIDESGFQKESYEEWKARIEGYIQEEEGEEVDLDPTGAWGQIATVGAKLGLISDDQQEESYLARDPDNATGSAATKLSAETGTYRKEATATIVSDALLLGKEGTVVPSDSQVTQAPDFLPVAGLSYFLADEVTITKTDCRKVVLVADENSGAGFTYTITIESVPYTHTTVMLETQSEAIDEIIAQLPVAYVGAKTGDDTLTIVGTLDMNFNWGTTFALEELWSAGTFVSNIKGDLSCAPSSLTVIVTSESGWNGVTNPNSGTLGTDEESDTALLIRRRSELVKGKATNAAMQNALNEVDNVTFATAISNRTMFVVDGQNAKSVESVVSGGDDDDIAQAIYETIAGGIEYFGRGGYSGTAIDPFDGQLFTVPFSRPIPVYIHVRYTRINNSEQSYPTDGDDLVKQALIDYAETRYALGDDIVRTELSVPFYGISGSILQLVEFAVTSTAGGIPTWVTTDTLTIAGSEFGQFDTTRVFVQIGS